MSDRQPRTRYYLHLAYYGTGYHGWQRQGGHGNPVEDGKFVSVQEGVEEAVTAALEANSHVNVTCVSRTDAGTHALSQYGVIQLTYPPTMSLPELRDRINSKLDERIKVHAIGRMPVTSFPKRIRSYCKKYIYYIQQGLRPDLDQGKYSSYIGRTLDVSKMREALGYLQGTHDFGAFAKSSQLPEGTYISTVRTIKALDINVKRKVNFTLDLDTCGSGESMDESDISTEPSSPASKRQKLRDGVDWKQSTYFICIELTANGFLRHMVRRIVGTLRFIGEGTHPPSRMKQILDGEIKTDAVASARGLWLHRTWLTEEDWEAYANENNIQTFE